MGKTDKGKFKTEIEKLSLPNDVMLLLDEAAKDFPLIYDSNEIERLNFYDMLINQSNAPKMTSPQQKEILVALMECTKWYLKWFGSKGVTK